MATIQDIIDAVEADTGRPDKSALIQRVVKATIIKAHEIDFFPRDRVEDTDVSFGAAAATITVSLPTRWRKFELIRPLDEDGNAIGKEFERRSTDNTRKFGQDFANDLDRKYFEDYYFVLGDNVRIFAENTVRKLHWVYFEYPDLGTLTNSTWITDNYEQAIIDGASFHVYNRLGYTNQASGALELWRGNPRQGIMGWVEIIRQHCIEDF